MESIRIPYGLKDGHIVHISEVDRGLECGCVCINCDLPLVAKKGKINTPHFAHASDTTCNPETVLHKMGKIYAEQNFSLSSDNFRLISSYNCMICHSHEKHEINLTNYCHTLSVERNFKGFRPDISFFDHSGNPACFIEIVVSHKPTTDLIGFCFDHKIPLMQFKLKNFDDLSKLIPTDEGYIYPDFVFNGCTEPTCKKCGRVLQKRQISIINTSCWRCKADMNVAFGVNKFRDHYSISFKPEDFTEAELHFCRQKGVNLKRHFSQTVGASYLASTCNKCGTFCGNFFLHEYASDIFDHNVHDMGLFCSPCNIFEPK